MIKVVKSKCEHIKLEDFPISYEETTDLLLNKSKLRSTITLAKPYHEVTTIGMFFL